LLISATGAVVFLFLLLRKEYFYLTAIGLSHLKRFRRSSSRF
jgi:hypothetical protein